jgi:hypothetical protein
MKQTKISKRAKARCEVDTIQPSMDPRDADVVRAKRSVARPRVGKRRRHTSEWPSGCGRRSRFGSASTLFRTRT